VAWTSAKAPVSNGCFEVSVALPGASPWPPPAVTEKVYSAAVGTLLWSKFNGDRRLAGPTVDVEMAGIAERLELLASGSEEFAAAVEAAAAARLVANAPKKKKKPASDAPVGATSSLAPPSEPTSRSDGGPPARRVAAP
jgi:hypothetical protein